MQRVYSLRGGAVNHFDIGLIELVATSPAHLSGCNMPEKSLGKRRRTQYEQDPRQNIDCIHRDLLGER